ncbi:MAG: Fe-S cluster assembly protein SufD [Salinisphaera sp.]|nr:Fe-S cluster assembly protein SufD [Salinisphaera sp.]
MSLEHYREEFARQRLRWGGDRLGERREAALQAFTNAGFPTTHQENWKYTDLRGLTKRHFRGRETPAMVDADALTAALPKGMVNAHRMVFVDGRFSAELSAPACLPAGVTVETLSQRLAAHADSDVGFGNCVNGYASALTDMNTAFVSDGLCLTLAEDAILDAPIHLVIVAGGQQETMAQLRHLLRLGAHSRATLIEHHIGLGDQSYLCNAVTELRAGPGAQLTRVRLQEESAQGYHVSSLHARLDRDSLLSNHGVDFGGRLVRADTNVNLAAEGAQVQLNGVYVASGRQHIDNHTRVDHNLPHGTSRETYKGIVSGRGRGVFNGKVVVHEGAQKTDSEQSSAALLLSDKAEVDAKPELEIYADDVKCAHGSTVGQLDEAAVFYLMSRGIAAHAARAILTYSFADALIADIPVAGLREHIEAALLAKLGYDAGGAALA